MPLQEILMEYEEYLVEEMIDRYKLSFNELDTTTYSSLATIVKKILEATVEKDSQLLKTACHEMAILNYSNEIPYLVVVNELHGLKSHFTSILIEKNAKDEVFELQKVYSSVENILAYEHLGNYMSQLMHTNNTRINSIKDLIKKHLVHFYQNHLEWLNQLAHAIGESDSTKFPEMNHSLCEFGHWLEHEGKAIISNNSKYKYILSIHATLHSLARAIKTQMDKEIVNYNVLVSYLEKCEFISLAIGTELALIDNRLIIKDATKDEMTQALNRNSLEQIFINQYELALATNNSFILAMCDLDHFKEVNDTYGHVAGDNVLKNFVSIIKNRLRDSDIIIRYGGEEFIILLPNSNLENGEHKLEELREEFSKLCCQCDGVHIGVSVSIGAKEIKPSQPYSQTQKRMKEWIEDADHLLYEAKKTGRNKVVID